MSSKSRGAAFEKRLQVYLESLGFQTDRARPRTMVLGKGRILSGPNDFFGCADLIGLSPQKSYTLFVQATLGNVRDRKPKVEAIRWNFSHHLPMIWERYAPGVIRAHQLTSRGEWVEHLFKLKDGLPAPFL